MSEMSVMKPTPEQEREKSKACGNPLLAKRMRRGGSAIRIDPHSFVGADGVVSFFSNTKGKPPRPRLQRMLRSVYLMPRPPLLIRFARRGLPLAFTSFASLLQSRLVGGVWRT